MAPHPFEKLRKTFKVGDKEYKYFSLPDMKDDRIAKLPQSIKILLEVAVRSADDGLAFTPEHVETILDWANQAANKPDIPFKPARVILQDFTGVPAVVDLAAMRDAVQRLGGDGNAVQPLVPVDLVIDHSVQVDVFGTKDAQAQNEKIELERNYERFQFLKWGSTAFNGLSVSPPGVGIVHQVNLEYLARAIFEADDGTVYFDSCLGTDSHTTMINGLGVLGWGVGGIEAEATMLGQAVSMVLPQVVGMRLTGALAPECTPTDLVLTVTQKLREHGCVGKFVEFTGPGVRALALADRALIANMSPEYGATMGYWPMDQNTLDYLHMTGRSEAKVAMVEAYLRAQGVFVDENTPEPEFTSLIHLNMDDIRPCVSGPKRPHDRVDIAGMQQDFRACLTNPIGFKGFGLSDAQLAKTASLTMGGKTYEMKHGSLVIAAITSCTNTSNPTVMLGSGFLARNAVAQGLSVPGYVKTSLAPGSGVIGRYLESAGLLEPLEKLGFSIVAQGCTTCIGNSGPLAEEVVAAIQEGDLVAGAVLSGNRNFEGRVNPHTRANYLASPPLVVAYAIAGRLDIDFETEPLGQNAAGKDVFLRDVWPDAGEVSAAVTEHVTNALFKEVYSHASEGTPAWNALPAPEGAFFEWSDESTYIHNPPFFQSMALEPAPRYTKIENARALIYVGDSVTTDHISPAGQISKTSPAARYLAARGVAVKDFNSYGSRRGNDEIMGRGTFANVRLTSKFFKGKAMPKTLHVPTGDVMDVWDVAERYMAAGTPTIVLAGDNYGMGSSRDWAAKGVDCQGVKAVIAKSYERIHRSNLALWGLLPMCFREGENADSLGLTGKEEFSIDLEADLAAGTLRPLQDVVVSFTRGDGSSGSFTAVLRLDTPAEIEFFKNGGALPLVIRKIVKQSPA